MKRSAALRTGWTKDLVSKQNYYYIYDAIARDITIANMDSSYNLNPEEYRSVVPVPMPVAPNPVVEAPLLQ